MSYMAEEVAQELRALIALAEDWARFLAPTWQLTSTCSPRFKGLMMFSDLPEHQAHTWHTDIYAGRTSYT